ncbi:hypothetical protein PILCRDRAFT_819632 [Piloderma croceum F 1598]|uniref:Uncharacterized protein n=1 Tax=Piloderma croceum (strain F 1598) TaxID=765440 RepID=A0A0C3C1B6_PILCF|nr:hypothetical protein PILCRDRAFT_819632 [Piloderma croceum F 1598]
MPATLFRLAVLYHLELRVRPNDLCPKTSIRGAGILPIPRNFKLLSSIMAKSTADIQCVGNPAVTRIISAYLF